MINTNVKVNVPGRSSFDKSFKNILTTKVGTITPLCCKYVMPGSKGHIKLAISASLPPLASDTFMRAALKVEAFLVPMRLLYGGTESWLTGKSYYNVATDQLVRAKLPVLEIGGVGGADYATHAAFLGPGSLADYLGFRPRLVAGDYPNSPSYYNMMPFLAYHRVYDDWYRNPYVAMPVFTPPLDHAPALDNFRFLPFVAFDYAKVFPITSSCTNFFLYSLHQRMWGDDYFTIAKPQAQFGSAQAVSTSGNSFTISALRSANSLQQFSERSNLASPNFQDYLKAHYGCDLSSGVAQRAILLGSASYDVYSKGIEANAANSATNNPFTSVGARYGNAFASGTDFVCDYEANEPCYLLINATLVPEANYSTGISHEFLLLNAAGSEVDLPDPLLENTGNEPIYANELSGIMTGSVGGVPNPGAVFGYVPKNTWYKSNENQVHGLLRAGQSLDSFVAQRQFTSQPGIGTTFLTIPTTALDNVTAVTADLSQYGVWIDAFIDYKASEPLTESAMPSLQDPAYEHGHPVTLHIGGSKL